MPSWRHRLLADVLPRVRPTPGPADPDTGRREKVAEQDRADPRPPRRALHGVDVTQVPGTSFPVHAVSPSGSTPGRAVLYLHGGGYVNGADRNHWSYCASLARRLDARVVLPLYPLAPRHTWRDSRSEMAELFERLAVGSPRGVAVAGDSAGGGYALALAQQLRDRAGPQPTHVVLISPWLDATCSAPDLTAAARDDPWLDPERLRVAGSWWAGEDDPARPEVSPLYGDLTGLPPTLMFCGTRDCLHLQCRELVRRAEGTGWRLTYLEEADLLHVYPILRVREARKARDQAAVFLRRRDD